MFGEINFLMFAVYLFLASAAVMVLVSLLTAPPPDDKTRGLTVGGGKAEGEPRTWTKWDVIHTGIVLCIIVTVYLYFSGLFFG